MFYGACGGAWDTKRKRSYCIETALRLIWQGEISDQLPRSRSQWSAITVWTSVPQYRLINECRWNDACRMVEQAAALCQGELKGTEGGCIVLSRAVEQRRPEKSGKL